MRKGYLVSIHKLGFLFKIKPPARRAYAPEGHAKKITTGICLKFRGLFFEHNAETCPPLVDWTKRPFMDGHYLMARCLKR